jgi:hypothetical protein
MVGQRLGAAGYLVLVEPMASRIPASQHTAFITVAFTHWASYGIGIAGGFILAAGTWRRRRGWRRTRLPDPVAQPT